MLNPERVGKVVDVMKDLAGTGVTMIVITYEIRFARQVAELVMFKDGGEIVETGIPEEIFTSLRYAGTRNLLSAVLIH